MLYFSIASRQIQLVTLAGWLTILILGLFAFTRVAQATVATVDIFSHVWSDTFEHVDGDTPHDSLPLYAQIEDEQSDKEVVDERSLRTPTTTTSGGYRVPRTAPSSLVRGLAGTSNGPCGGIKVRPKTNSGRRFEPLGFGFAQAQLLHPCWTWDIDGSASFGMAYNQNGNGEFDHWTVSRNSTGTQASVGGTARDSSQFVADLSAEIELTFGQLFRQRAVAAGGVVHIKTPLATDANGAALYELDNEPIDSFDDVVPLSRIVHRLYGFTNIVPINLAVEAGIIGPVARTYDDATVGDAGYMDERDQTFGFNLAWRPWDVVDAIPVTLLLQGDIYNRGLTFGAAFEDSFDSGDIRAQFDFRYSDKEHNTFVPDSGCAQDDLSVASIGGSVAFNAPKWITSVVLDSTVGIKCTNIVRHRIGGAFAYDFGNRLLASIEGGYQEVKSSSVSGQGLTRSAGVVDNGVDPAVFGNVLNGQSPAPGTIAWLLNNQPHNRSWVGVGVEYEVRDGLEVSGGIKYTRQKFDGGTYNCLCDWLVSSRVSYSF